MFEKALHAREPAGKTEPPPGPLLSLTHPETI